MNLDLFALIRNEAQMLPFFLRHYGFARRIVLFDDDSTDDTRRIALADKRVEVRPVHFGGFKEDVARILRNTCYRGSDADWVVVADCDEFLYHRDLWGQLLAYREMGITLPSIHGFEMVAEHGLPDYSGELTDVIKTGVLSQMYSKNIIFNPTVDIRYYIGCHDCDPRGNVVRGGNLQLLHFNMIGAGYIIDRWKRQRLRVDPRAADLGWKTYDWSEERLRSHHADLWRQAKKVI